MLTPEQIKEQSIRAYSQWADEWRKNASFHAKYDMPTLAEFENSGIGRPVVCVANGYSTELEIEALRKYQDQADIFCCDKSLGLLLDHGVTPKFCMVCDAKVPYSKYLEPWRDKLQDTILFQNVCGNPEWTTQGNWKARYFFTCMDTLQSEQEFAQISGCPTAIAAGTNVSNAMVVLLTQSDNKGRRNFFGYDKILLIGYDYAWKDDGKYYAFDKEGGGKFYYMRHMYLRNIRNDLCFSSNNLAFSAKWLESYLIAFKLPVVQCSRDSVLPLKNMGVLSEQMQYSFKPEHQKQVVEMIRKRNEYLKKKIELEAQLIQIGREHYYSMVATV